MTPRLAVRNFLNVWMLVQAVWLSAITIVTGRLRDKWPLEDTLSRLDGALHRAPPPLLTRADWGTIAFALAAAGAAWTFR